MGTAIGITGLVGAIGVTLIFFQMLHVKTYYTYEGRHHTHTAPAVPPEYIPEDAEVRYREMWTARMREQAKLLTVPVWRLGECHQDWLKQRLSNYGWTKVPTNEWPLQWQGQKVGF